MGNAKMGLTEEMAITLNNNCPLPKDGKNLERYERCEYVYSTWVDILDENERKGVEDWQDEIFSPQKTFKTLDEEFKARSKFHDDCLDEALEKGSEWLFETCKDGYSSYENVVFNENGKKTHLLDRMMLHRQRNPMLTNLSLAESVPGSRTRMMPKAVMNLIFDVKQTLGGNRQVFRKL